MYAKFTSHVRKALNGTMLLSVAFSALGTRNLPATRTLEAGSETRTGTAAPIGSTAGTIATSFTLASPDRCLTRLVRITIASEQISFCAPTSLPINIVEDSISDPYVNYAGLDQINGYGIVNIKATTPGNTPGIGRPVYNLSSVVEYRQAVWNIESSKTDRIVSNGPTGIFWNETVPSIQIDMTLPTSLGNLRIRSIEWYVEQHGRLWSFIMDWDTKAQSAQEWSEASRSFIIQAPDETKLADTALDLGAVFLKSKVPNGIPELGVPIDVGAPPWWSGICDDTNFFNSTHIHSTLLSSWHGVSVCGSVPHADYLVHFFPGAWGEFEFECVELVMRFLYQEWGIAPWAGNANTIKNSPPDSIVFYPNGTHAIVPGDIITEDGPTQNSSGHAVIVTGVYLDGNGTGTVNILEQNASSTGQRPLSVQNWQVQNDEWNWGSPIQGWLHVKTNSSLVTTISAGMRHTCWVKSDETVACWGDNSYGQSTSPAGTFVQVSAGYKHTCGLKSDGTITCWGSNVNGQARPPTGTFTQVSAGYAHTCGLKSDGTVFCWGSNANGRATPPGGTFIQVSAGYAHTCGLKSDGTLVCWGSNTYGQATPPTGTFAQVSAGGSHTCGLKNDGTVFCWGSNANGRATPPTGTFTQVSAGYKHTCGLKSDATVACWGDNTYGQASPPAGTFAQVSAGYAHTCGLKSDGTVVCWGDNTYGQSAPFSISGNAGMGGTTLNYTDGGPKTTTVASDGSYSLTVSYGWSGMVTPSLTGYTFSPSNRSYTNILANQTAQNYTATAITYTISGNAGVGWATLSYTGGTPVTAGSTGNYTLRVPYNWTGTVTPSKTGVTFTPANRTYTNVTSNKTSQDYAASFTATFNSNGSRDGWILETAKGSGVGGTKDAIATTFILGDDISNRQYRAILCFNTSSLPDNATIQSAVLKIDQSESPPGPNPFTSLGNLYADIRMGYFGSSSYLQLTDFNAAATADEVGTFGSTPVSGWYSATLNSTGRSNINKTSLTQFRLYFSKETNANNQADYMQFFSGDASSGQPQLIVTYTLP